VLPWRCGREGTENGSKQSGRSRENDVVERLVADGLVPEWTWWDNATNANSTRAQDGCAER
jgi:hypothetical protein